MAVIIFHAKHANTNYLGITIDNIAKKNIMMKYIYNNKNMVKRQDDMQKEMKHNLNNILFLR